MSPSHLVSFLSLVCHGKPLLQRGEKHGCSQWLATPQMCWYIKPVRLHMFPSCSPENSTWQGRAACRGWAGRRIQPARKTTLVAEYEKLIFSSPPAPPQHSRSCPIISPQLNCAEAGAGAYPAHCCGNRHRALGLLLAWGFSGCEKSRSST